MELKYKPKNDLMFKMIFLDENNRDILIDFLNALVPELPEEEYEVIEIKNPINDIDFIEDKLTIMDLKLRTKSGHFINVEMQLVNDVDFKDRAIFYLSKLVASQKKRGDDTYKLNKCIAVLICDFNLFKESTKVTHRFTFKEDNEHFEFSDTVAIKTMELKKLKENKENIKLMDWLEFLASETVETLEHMEIKGGTIKKAIDTVHKLTYSEEFKIRYEEREQARMDHEAKLKNAENEGKKLGIEQGIKEGIKEGILKEKLKTAKNMLKKGIDKKIISEVTELNFNELNEIEKNF